MQHTDIGHCPNENDVAHVPHVTEIVIEPRAIERVVAVLLDAKLPRLWRQVIDDVPSPRAGPCMLAPDVEFFVARQVGGHLRRQGPGHHYRQDAVDAQRRYVTVMLARPTHHGRYFTTFWNTRQRIWNRANLRFLHHTYPFLSQSVVEFDFSQLVWDNFAVLELVFHP